MQYPRAADDPRHWLYGVVLLAISLSVAELQLRVARPHDAVLGRVPGLAGMHDLDDHPDAQTIPGPVVEPSSR